MEIKPLRKSASMPLVRSVRGTTLTRYADELLIARADVVSEGSSEPDGSGGAIYNGSTMVAIPLDGEGLGFRLGAPGAADHLVESARRAISLRVRLLRIARAEAERRCEPLLVRSMEAALEFRIEGRALFVDIVVECPLAAPERDRDGVEEIR